jgi:hypothetical protein
MDAILFILGFLGTLSIPCVVIGLFGSLYAIGKNEKVLDFFTKMTIYSLLTCIITFGIIVYCNA